MSKLKIAIQKAGRLQEDSLRILKDCGIKVDNGRDQLRVEASNFPLELYYLRNSDIPQYVEDGVVDIAVVGENLLIEKKSNLEIVKRLGFSKCRLSLAVPKDVNYTDLSFFESKQIATSYPNTLADFLAKNQINATIHTISGSVEIAPTIGLADGIMDIVSSGNTLYKNGLKEVTTLFSSEAVLVKSSNLTGDQVGILEQLLFRLNAVLKAKDSRYVLMNVPTDKINEVAKILPVLKSPTVLPLAEKGWSSLHSVINNEDFWNVIDQLKLAGATDILVIPIEKIVL
jgi:ATP phosphoribosyltransferase